VDRTATATTTVTVAPLPMHGLLAFSARGVQTGDAVPDARTHVYVVTEKIIRGGVKIGYDTVRITPTGNDMAVFTMTWVLYGRGTLVARATVHDNNDSDALVLNVVRGSGQFVRVAGTVTLTPTDNDDVLNETFRLRLG
jgi:hypothetical protein